MIKLLIADDEGFVRRGLINNIRWAELGVDFIEQADDGINAYEKAIEAKVDILLTDVRMPRMDGIELAFKVRESLPDCKIIFMSAYSDKEYLKSAIHLKAISYIEKPIDPIEISNVITSAVALCIEEEKKRIAEISIKKSLEESTQIFRNNISMELIRNNFNKEILQKLVADTQLKVSQADHFSILLFKLKTKAIVVNDTIKPPKAEILKTIEGNCFSYGLKYLSGFKDDETIITLVHFKPLSSNSEEINHLREVCRRIIKETQDKYHIFISVGKVVNNIFQLSESYQAAVTGCQELFFKGFDNLVLGGKSTCTNEIFEFDEAIIPELGKYLEDCEKEKCQQLLLNLSKSIKSLSHTQVNYIKNIYFRLLMQLINSSVKRGINLYSDESERFYWEIISGYDTLDAIEKYLLKLIDSYFKQIEERSSLSRTVSDIIKSINKAYNDPDLSVKWLSSKLFLSHSYICVIFKKETGKTINQYITEYRIEKAKELLKDKRIKLSEVATRVGYSDHNYFTKIFKKSTNITPSEYKEKYLL